MIKIKPSKTKLGQAVYLEFQITQQSRDIELMNTKMTPKKAVQSDYKNICEHFESQNTTSCICEVS